MTLGHGEPDGGTTSKNGVSEQEINLQIAYELKNILEKSNYSVIMTRTGENGIYESSLKTIREKKVSDSKKRVEIANSSDADIFISIHLNYYEEEKYKGWQTFYNATSKDSMLLANLIQQGLNDSMGIANNRQPKAIKDVYIIEHVKIPTVIVECGFLSNKEDEENLQNKEYQVKLAEGILQGINEYYKQKEL